MENNKSGSKAVKWILVGISFLFIFVMLILPLITVITEALRSGWNTYIQAVTDEYTVKAVLLTIEATVCAVMFNTMEIAVLSELIFLPKFLEKF